MTDWTYIPIDEEIDTDPRFIRFFHAAGMGPDQAIGWLWRLWRLVKRRWPDGIIPMSIDDLTLVLGGREAQTKALLSHGYLI